MNPKGHISPSSSSTLAINLCMFRFWFPNSFGKWQKEIDACGWLSVMFAIVLSTCSVSLDTHEWSRKVKSGCILKQVGFTFKDTIVFSKWLQCNPDKLT